MEADLVYMVLDNMIREVAMLSYEDRIQGCIISALRNTPCTFEEIIKKCAGVYPTEVQKALSKMNIHSSLVPLYTTQENYVPFDMTATTDAIQAELITYNVENNPVLSNWYFSWHTCQKIGQLDLWQNKRILFLGTPRLFEFFAIQKKAKLSTLVDLDSVVIDRLKEKYNNRIDLRIERRDINYLLNTSQEKYDYVFFDPPWYREAYLTWLKIASQFCASDGKMVFPLLPYLVRPTASSERKEIINISRSITPNVLLIPEYLEYDIPTFEEKELHYSGIDLRTNWKVSDLLILQGMHTIPAELENVIIDSEYLVWKEHNWLGIRWFIKTCQESDGDNKSKAILRITLIDGTKFLKTPSHQNPQLKAVNVLSSKGHGFCVSNAAAFVTIMNEINQYRKDEFIDTVWRKYSIDEKAKNVIEEIRGEKI